MSTLKTLKTGNVLEHNFALTAKFPRVTSVAFILGN